MIYIFTNRNITRNNKWLGEGFNSESNENIRVAKYIPHSKPRLDFYDENEDELLPSLQVIEEVEKSQKPCCIFIHGFNQSLNKNLKKCEEIESYGVNVIAFSWPSNPGPEAWWWKLKEYKAATQNARRSTVALERFFDKFANYVYSVGNLNNIKSLVTHSLGCYLLQSYVSSLGCENQTGFLKNILLHQADVNSLDHEMWVDKLAKNSRVLVTINETDDELDYSDIINPDRLGNTLGNLNSNLIQYFNFGLIPEAEDEHRLWIQPTIENENAKKFFEAIFTGSKIRTGHLDYDNIRNVFHIR